MKFICIPSGNLVSGIGENGINIEISSDFYIQTTEVTQAQFKTIMGTNPSYFSNNDKHPVENISWDDVQKFLKKLNLIEKNNGYNYRLPTEAEWIYASRAGGAQTSKKGQNVQTVRSYVDFDFVENFMIDPYPSKNIAWFSENSCGEYKYCSNWDEVKSNCLNCGTHPVARKEVNVWGLYDMFGNVWEWCRDKYTNKPMNHHRSELLLSNSQLHSNRVIRGGSWKSKSTCNNYDNFEDCTIFRKSKSQSYHSNSIGFRLIMTLE